MSAGSADPAAASSPPALVADAFTAAGHAHGTCQDAVGVSVDGRLAVLCDGCSSSPATHLGAGLLAHGTLMGCELGEVAGWLRAARLPVEALDATLLTARADPEGITIEIAGDGGFAVRGLDGGLRWWWVVQPAGAPAYPAYALAPARLTAWRATFGDAREIHTGALPSGGPSEPEPAPTLAPGHAPLRWRFPWDAVDAVALFSDGLGSFQRPGDTPTSRAFDAVPFSELIPDLFAIPLARGAFLQRRARRLLDRTRALGWRHLDDLSAAMICRATEG